MQNLVKGGKPTQSHSKVCRERIRECLKDNPEDAELLKKVDDRRDEHISRLIEEQDEGSAESGKKGDPGSSSRGRDQESISEDMPERKKRRPLESEVVIPETRDEVLNDDDDDDLAERGTKRSEDDGEVKRAKRRIHGNDSDHEELLNVHPEEPAFIQSKGGP